MSAQSSRLGLPYLASGQAQKHVTVCERDHVEEMELIVAMRGLCERVASIR